MKENLTELVFILDRSGSMGGLEESTILGYNNLIEKQKQEKGEVVLTTVLFNDSLKVIHDSIDIKSVKPLTKEEYYVGGCTALLDAIGRSIVSIGNKLNKTKEELRPSKVLFVITTDGMENASYEYSFMKVKEMIKHQTKKYSWEFLFLGANIDAIGVAEDIGIKANRAVRYNNDFEGIDLNYMVLGEYISDFIESGEIDDNWKEKIEEDYKNRSK